MRPQAHGTIGPFTTLALHKQHLPRAPATAVALYNSSRRLTTSTGWATAAPARPAVTAVTAIIFVCWRCRSTTCRSARSPPAARSSEKHAGILSPKRPSSGSISDNLSPDYPTQVIRRLSKSMSNRADFDKTGPPGMRIFLCGDVMLGRGIDQALPYPCAPDLHEEAMGSAAAYLQLAERANGPLAPEFR